MNMRLGGAITALPYQAVASAWHDLQVGGGGNVVGLHINPTDGTFLHWGDVFGGYVSNTANAGSNGNWQQVITAASMPNVGDARDFFTGGWAMASSAHNSNTVVFSYNGNVSPGGSSGVMISRNKCATWTAITAITTTGWGRAGRYTGTIVFNPVDDSEFYVGLPGSGGLWHCTSYGASATRLDPGTIPSATGNPEASFQGMAWVGNTILIGSYGNGVYISTNGSAGPFTLDSGSPTKPFSGGMAADGVTYFCLNDTLANGNATGDVYRRSSGGTWTNILSGQGVNGLALDPNNKDHIAVIVFNGNTNVSTNATGSATWAGFNGWTMSSGDVPWMAWSFGGNFSFLNATSCWFDGSGRFWVSCGIGVVYTTSLSGTVNYIPMTQGDEGLVGNQARWIPGGPAFLAAWDRPLWVVTNPQVTQSTHAPFNDNGVSIVTNYSDTIGYAQNNSSFLVGSVGGSPGSDLYYSSNTGVNWTKATTKTLTDLSGAIAVMSPTTWIVCDHKNGNVTRTIDSGTNWTSPTGLTAGAFFTPGEHANFQNLCYDAVTPGKAYIEDSSGTIWVSTDSGASWTQASATGALPTTNTGPMRLKAVNGKAGHLLWASGNNQNAPSAQPSPTNQPLYFSSNSGANWSQVTNANNLITIPWAVGTTPAAPGQSYPSIAIYGWIKTPNTGGKWVLDVWRCDNFDPLSPGSASMVWTQMFYPGIALPSDIEGNPNAYNQWILSMGGNTASAQGWNYYGPAGLMV